MKSAQEVLKSRMLKSLAVGEDNPSLSRKTNQDLKGDVDLVLNFLEEKDVPKWFRGGSRFQMEAIKSLFHSIRDDTEQRTTHRVRESLTGLGLYPLPSHKDIKLLMRLSRGNDLAFLWFLMEMHYKTSDTKYSVNEQLILSAISHLDMVTTLRELDRILPPGNPSKKILERRKKLEEERTKKPIRKAKENKRKFILPYFEKLKRKRLLVKPIVHMPDFKVRFGQYNVYKNPNHVVINESNRWFADYKLSDSKRIVHSIFKDQFQMLFGNTATELEQIAGSNDAHEVNTTIENGKKKVLCTYHLKEEINKELGTKMTEFDNRRQCEESLDPRKSYKAKIKHTNFMDKLEKDVESYRKIIRKKPKLLEKQNQVNIIGKDCFCQYFINDDENEEACIQLGISGNEEGQGEAEIERLRGGCEFENNGNQSNEPDQLANKCNTINEQNDDSTESMNVSIRNLPSYIHRLSKMRLSETQRSGSECSKKQFSKSSEQFFKPPQEHKPYEFDYHKIFKLNLNNDERLKLKQLYLDALDCDEKSVKKLLDDTPDIMDAVNKAAKRTWKEQVQIQKQRDREQEPEKEKASDLVYKFEDHPYIPKRDWYDCEDQKLMDTMLKEALKYMSRNRKYVLASMHDSWKLPMLREWICHRYGKSYSLKERILLFRNSMKIFRALNRIQLTIPTPGATEIGNNFHVDYSIRRYVAAKAEYIKRKFYDRLDKIIMDESRIFWFAMRPYICSCGPPRNTYFSYMPARVGNIHHIRPWNKKDFMNAKSAWDTRQREKRRKAAY